MAGLVDFKDENEVKEYLENLGTEYWYQCHREKDADGCYRLAEYLEGIKADFDSAAKILKLNCDQNDHSESCYKLGAYHITGKGGLVADFATAYNYYLKSCLKGGKKSIYSCHNVALLAQDGRMNDGKPDVHVARDYFMKACDAKYAQSCFRLSTMYLEGAPGIPKDMTQALHFSEKACEMEHIHACANASRMYRLGDGVKKDDAKAETLKKRTMDLHEKQKGVKEITFGI